MPRVGSKRKKKHTEKEGEGEASEREKKRTPRCFVIKRGKVGDRLRDLVKDFRMVMMPNCAKALRESRLNRVEDFIQVAGHFHVTHIVVFSATPKGTYMKLIKLPQGPTLTFKVNSFTLARDIKAAQRRPRQGDRDYITAPLQVLNGYGAGDANAEKQLAAEMVRGMFPPIDVPTFDHHDCRRVALFNFDKTKDVTHFRHYSVARKEVGIQRGVSKLLRKSRLVKLGNSQDVADFILSGGAGASESEADEPTEAPSGDGKVGVRLTECGPRLELLLVKAEDGICVGNVLYHRYNKHTLTQIEVNAQKAAAKRKFKERNDKLTVANMDWKARKKKAKEDRRKSAKSVDEDDGNGDAQRFGAGAAGDSDSEAGAKTVAKKGGEKKKKFHPLFGISKRDKKKAAAGDAPEKAAIGGKGGGKGKDVKGKGGGKRGGREGGGSAGQRVLDKFKKVQKPTLSRTFKKQLLTGD